jgi:protein-L-isoaspartate(D-aspartate) O-methyltransferase
VCADEARKFLERILSLRVHDARVLGALLDTPRPHYLPESVRPYGYEDRALPLAEGQTVSQPTIVGMMTEAVAPAPSDTVLDVGTGSGYQAAVLARLARRVFGIEVRSGLAKRARQALDTDAGVPHNAHLVIADAYRGFPGRMQFDAIVVAAAAYEVPRPLIEQLAPGGRLVAPLGPPGIQDLVLLRRELDGSLRQQSLGGCAFVPLVHAEGPIRS